MLKEVTFEIEKLKKEIERYVPFNEQEERDKQIILEILENEDNVLTRENQKYHFTVSAWIVTPDRKKVLMCYHNIYNSWAWLGGHTDGESNLREVILKEVREESGVTNIKFLLDEIFSLEILTVDGHIKKGKYVSSHLHLNITFLLEAEETEKLLINPDENSDLDWIAVEKISIKSSEKWFVENIYSKLNTKVEIYQSKNII
ncbi:NUDIX hydrolase [uncultured Fusobacterium sp.]|uniref:NUDIX hydrolase n=1 Tax=uncultured Fusobacterium sp. TaxID=159267 RepID=UPI0025E856EC|nr:NUDIX hydrolase [uncultured Fusobacterium sp.]